jgi:hypothetical protein
MKQDESHDVSIICKYFTKLFVHELYESAFGRFGWLVGSELPPFNISSNVKNIKKLSELELKRNLKTSWHDQYKDSAWIFVGGLPYDLTEGDVVCVFSQ